MTSLTVVALVGGTAALVIAAIWLQAKFTRRAATLAQPFPPAWRVLLESSLPLYSRIPPALRTRLEPLVRAFLGDVRFVGCNGLVVTDEMRLVIATQACLLVVERNPQAYHDLMSVLLYPEEFVVNRTAEDEAGVVTEFEDVLSGESQDTSKIVLSWRDIKEPAAHGEIVNVVLHEFAHYLDNSVDGAFTDIEDRREALEAWHDVLESEFNAHCDALEAGEPTLIDPDGAEHPAEFFAYATEVFFEAPQPMQSRHPHLYEGLKSAYGLDPAAW
jgi:Mlc titration factor MtfA (ptsG expression regulator)